MNTESSDNPNRKGKRVHHHFFIRFRETYPNSSDSWDMSTVRNISKTGVLFNASRSHNAGSILELKLRDPLLNEESSLQIKVLRCKPAGIENMNEIAATIMGIDEKTREAFEKTIDLFVKQEEEKKG